MDNERDWNKLEQAGQRQGPLEQGQLRVQLEQAGQRAQLEQAGSLAQLSTTSTTGAAGAPAASRTRVTGPLRTGRGLGELMAWMDNEAITARMTAIALLAPSSARSAMLELRKAPNGLAARPGFGRAPGREESRATGRRARGVAIRGESGSGHGREEWRFAVKLGTGVVERSGGASRRNYWRLFPGISSHPESLSSYWKGRRRMPGFLGA